MLRIAIVVAAVLFTVPATASAKSAVLTLNANFDRATVSYADLDLSSAAGQRKLKRRLSGAIEDVCGSFAGVKEDSEERKIAACRASAWQSVSRQLAARSSTLRLAVLSVR